MSLAAFAASCLTPLSILLLLIVVGCLLGKIRIFGISLDLAAVLILSVSVGSLFRIFSIEEWGESLFSAEASGVFRFLSSFGTALFLSSVGIGCGYGRRCGRGKKTVSLFFFGVAVSALNLFLLQGMLAFVVAEEHGCLYGVYCGAVTSTPGLAVLTEVGGSFAEKAATGYALSYLFGVSGVVLFVQFFSEKQTGFPRISQKEPGTSDNVSADLVRISAVILFGIVFGVIPLFPFRISLGNTGGILLSGICYGFFSSNERISENTLSLFRIFGLLLFFVGTGFPAGVELVSGFQPRLFLFGTVLTLFPMVFSYVILRFGFKTDRETALCVICGVMTSTPAYGILSRRGNGSSDGTVYSAAYVGSLCATVVGLRFLT